MRSEVTFTVHSKYVSRYKSGFPLIMKEAINHAKEYKEGDIVRLVDENNQFIAKGFIGEQNKGIGWVFTKNEQDTFTKPFFLKKLEKAIKHRKSLFEDTDTTAFRVCNGEGDGLGGVTIDYFEGYYVFNWYSEGVYSFHQEIIQSLDELVDSKGIYQKKRFDAGGKYIEDDDFVSGERAPVPLIVKENGTKFAIYLNEGAMVGVFLDQREVRNKIKEKYAKNKTVLNTFSYTGAFSVVSALGGATKTTSVDLANRSLPKTIEQFKINGVDYEQQDIVVQDVFSYFKYAKRKKLTFDLVILDPPSFARSKKIKFSVAKDYSNLLEEAIELLSTNGVIIASTNYSGFGMDKFKAFIKKAFENSSKTYKILEEYTLPEDFKTISQYKEGNYLKVAFIQVRQ
ncbi:class I SAM-dependent rRNA methyltransferase [Bacillus alkalicellulosilyticus]|uniref:class I SAM-dependent rRNA methyltransferase n=1 Tax=Alkalihalobacterium alkalicellulosilyticum TaxID=1912214 RepID=UPI000998797B|nr:class I SAM-dependent rRNA methyltransferase [Bacillus alkalicellulosilyticus]